MSHKENAEHAKGSCLSETRSAGSFSSLEFPGNVKFASLSTSDLQCCQTILQKASNFADTTCGNVLEVSADGLGRWYENVAEERLEHTMGTRDAALAKRIIFLSLDEKPDTSFGCQISASQGFIQRLAKQWQISPLFTNMLLGQYTANHIPAAAVQRFDDEGILSSIAYMSQQPRWGFRRRKFPISMFSMLHHKTGTSEYLVTHEQGDPRIETIQRRLTTAFCGSPQLACASLNASNPFLLQSLVAHEVFMDSDSVIFELGQSLYSTLDEVDGAAEEATPRRTLKSTTFKLHQISQDLDSLITSAHNNIAQVQILIDTQNQLAEIENCIPKHHLATSISDSQWLLGAFEARKRWLLGAQSRKDTAVNLVYHLVQQQDAETNLAIAQDSKNDSQAMKSIAALTMIFLPVSTVSSFFGMAFFSNGGSNQALNISSDWWLFWVVSGSLTVFVCIAWMRWHELVAWGVQFQVQLRSALSLKRVQQADLEEGK